MMNNLHLWESVERTPVEQTKQITGKSYQGNSPKPHHLIKRATETFGPCGIGWGFRIIEDRVVDAAVYEDGTPERMHYARVQVWYMLGGQRGEVEHVGGTLLSGRRKNGMPYTDDDAPKKSVTDALIKALSMIGFAGDIFLGRYDDSKYMAELQAEARDAKKAEAATKSPPQTRQPPKAPAKPAQPSNGQARADDVPLGEDAIPFPDDDPQVTYVASTGAKRALDYDAAVGRLEQAAEATTSLTDEDFAGLMRANAAWLKAPVTKALFERRGMLAEEWMG